MRIVHLAHRLTAERVVDHRPRPTLRPHHIIRAVPIHVPSRVLASSPGGPRRFVLAPCQAHVEHLPADGVNLSRLAPDFRAEAVANLIHVGPVELRCAPVRRSDTVTVAVGVGRVPEPRVEMVHVDVEADGFVVGLQIFDRDMHGDSAVGIASEGVAVTVVSAIVGPVGHLRVQNVLVQRQPRRARVATDGLAPRHLRRRDPLPPDQHDSRGEPSRELLDVPLHSEADGRRLATVAWAADHRLGVGERGQQHRRRVRRGGGCRVEQQRPGLEPPAPRRE